MFHSRETKNELLDWTGKLKTGIFYYIRHTVDLTTTVLFLLVGLTHLSSEIMTMRSAAYRLTRRLGSKTRLLSRSFASSWAPASFGLSQGAFILGGQDSKNSSVSSLAYMLGAAAVATGLVLDQQNKADCCGIIGVVAPKGYDARYVRKSLSFSIPRRLSLLHGLLTPFQKI